MCYTSCSQQIWEDVCSVFILHLYVYICILYFVCCMLYVVFGIFILYVVFSFCILYIVYCILYLYFVFCILFCCTPPPPSNPSSSRGTGGTPPSSLCCLFGIHFGSVAILCNPELLGEHIVPHLVEDHLHDNRQGGVLISLQTHILKLHHIVTLVC